MSIIGTTTRATPSSRSPACSRSRRRRPRVLRRFSLQRCFCPGSTKGRPRSFDAASSWWGDLTLRTATFSSTTSLSLPSTARSGSTARTLWSRTWARLTGPWSHSRGPR
eukprot:Amastigsp_a847131_2.p4 type:complete len:109 gc:universal Amastigsp_a847131_2:214-540(+)